MIKVGTSAVAAVAVAVVVVLAIASAVTVVIGPLRLLQKLLPRLLLLLINPCLSISQVE